MIKKIQSGVLAVMLSLMAIAGSGCIDAQNGRYPSPWTYAVPGLIGAGVGVGSAVLIGGIYAHQADKQMANQRAMMKDQAEMQRSLQDLQWQQQTDQVCNQIFAEISESKIGSAASRAAEARYEARGCTSKPR